jgi:hypothetical protein
MRYESECVKLVSNRPNTDANKVGSCSPQVEGKGTFVVSTKHLNNTLIGLC